MNQVEEINFLLDRFLEAETTLEEERRLYAYFSEAEVDPSLETYRVCLWHRCCGGIGLYGHLELQHLSDPQAGGYLWGQLHDSERGARGQSA